MSNRDQIAIAWSTTPNREVAEKIGHELVKQRLVACAQISGPITSIYRWEGKVCQEEEFRLVLKFPTNKETAVQAALTKLHPYDTPQWVVTHADSGSDAYLAWIHNSAHEDISES